MIYDITLPLSSQLPLWPGDPPFVLEQVEAMDQGAHVNVSRLSCSVHTGTHVDAPHHFLNDGRTVEGLSLEALIGPAWVAAIPPEVSLVTAAVLEQAAIPPGVRRLLLKTRNSALWQRDPSRFHPDFVAVAPDGAEWIVARGIALVGVDYLSVAPFQDSDPTHHVLLRAGVVILEGVDLSQVEAGAYELYCLPLKLVGSDGAPARAVLVR